MSQLVVFEIIPSDRGHHTVDYWAVAYRYIDGWGTDDWDGADRDLENWDLENWDLGNWDLENWDLGNVVD